MLDVRKSRSALVWLAVLDILVALAVPAYRWVFKEGGLDFGVYRTGGAQLLAGGHLYVDFPYPMPFSYPPFAAYLFVPFAWLPFDLGLIIFNLVSLVLAQIACIWVAKRWGADDLAAIWTGGLVVAVGTLLRPMFGNISLGQINMILMALVIFAWLLDDRPWLAGILLGLAIAIKIIPAGFGLLWLLNRRFLPLFSAGLTVAATNLLSWFFHPDQTVWYYRYVLFDSERPGAPGYVDNQSLRGLLIRSGLEGRGLEQVWAIAVQLLILACCLVILRNSNEIIQLLVCALTVLLVSPLSWSFHWCWIAPALVVGLFWAKDNRRRWRVIVAGLLVFGPPFLIPPEGALTGGFAPFWWLVTNLYVLTGLALLGWAVVGTISAQKGKPLSDPV